jgi:hypothetical protein
MEALRKKEMKLILPITIEDVVALGPTAEATLVYILKSILREKKNDGNSNISPCKAKI